MASSEKKDGRPRKAAADKDVPLKFSVPPDLHAYLTKLAGTRFVAASPDQMARHILIEAAEARRKEKYLGVEFNPGSGPILVAHEGGSAEPEIIEHEQAREARP